MTEAALRFVELVYPWIISAVGGFIGAALLLPTKLGETLIQFRVGKALENFKAQQARELENLKADLNHLSDRGRRSNEMEFQSIQTVWNAFVQAWLSTNTTVSQLISMPDFSRMDNDEAQSFAVRDGLNDDEQAQLLAAEDKGKEYVAIVSWRASIEAGADIYKFRQILREQRIFMPPSLTAEFSDNLEMMSRAQIQRKLVLQNTNFRSRDFGNATTVWIEKNMAIFENLALEANRRLFKEESS